MVMVSKVEIGSTGYIEIISFETLYAVTAHIVPQPFWVGPFHLYPIPF